MLIDMELLKEVNDRYGDEGGDDVVGEVGMRVGWLRGGDEGVGR